jgi:hypothetical protein
VRLLGVGLSNLVADEVPTQLALFEEGAHAHPDAETDRDRAIARTVDELRARFGRDAVLPGRIVKPTPRPTDDPDPQGT